MRRTFAVLGVIALSVAATLAWQSAALAQTSPTATATPNTGLVDGQSVTLGESGFLSLSGEPGTFVPFAFECQGGVFPASSLIDISDLALVQQALNQSCVQIGEFDVGADTLVVAVAREFTTTNGVVVNCGVTPGACALVVGGAAEGAFVGIGIAAAPITFAPPTPRTTDDCKNGGWRNLADGTGHPFTNQGQCVSWAVHHTR